MSINKVLKNLSPIILLITNTKQSATYLSYNIFFLKAEMTFNLLLSIVLFANVSPKGIQWLSRLILYKIWNKN